jgi:hypothetical protein
MRKFEISPVIAAQIRKRAIAANVREVAIPLYLELPRYDELRAPAFVEYDAEDSRVEAGGITIGGDTDDDDFY